VWQSPFEWLAKYGLKGIKGRWARAMAGTGVCPICHRDEKPFHVPTQCPILPELGLKLIPCPPVKPSLVATAPASASPAPSPSPTPAPSGRSAATDSTPLTESATAPSGLAALVGPVDASAQDDYDTDEDFQWDGDESGPAFTDPPKLNKLVPLYSTPSCSHAQALLAHPGASASQLISLPSRVKNILSKLSNLSPCPPNGGHLAVADTGATDQMIPDKSSFISYHLVSGLDVCMGNNSYIPVLGQGTAIFGLNGKRVLTRNVLHVPGLAVPLYSLHTHMAQPGCGFFGSESSRFLIYFPTFVLSMDTLVYCHLSYKPLGSCAPPGTLHYAQPRRSPTYYPSERALSSTAAAPPPPGPAFIKDDCSTAGADMLTSLESPVDTPTSTKVRRSGVSHSLT
jgi:hypothetical protein